MSEVNWVDMYLEPYAEEDETLNHWIDRLMRNVRWRLFENQEDWLYMAGELGEGMPPKFKDNARKAMYDACVDEFGWLISYMIDRLITEYRISNIDLDEDTIWNITEDLPEGGYEEWETECRKRIFNEYEQYLGHDRAIEHFKGIWTEGWFPE